MSITFGSVCSGIEAASVAFGPLGWHAAWLAEIEAFPSAVLAHHYPDVPNLGDMTTIARRILTGEVVAPDLLCGGTPCQAFSVAGLRESLADERGNLTLKFVELFDAIDFVRVRAGKPAATCLWENVPGVLSTKDNAFGCFLAGLAGEDGALQPPGGKWSNAGAVYGPRRAVAWRTLDAQYFGLAQRRRRVFVVASARAGFDPAQVLFEWDGMRRDSAPSREAGKGTAHDTAPCLTSSGRGVARTGDTRGQDPVVAAAFGYDGGVIHAPSISPALKARDHKGPSSDGDGDGAPLLAVTHSLRGEGFDASEDGTGRGTPLVPVGVTIHGTAPAVQKVASYDDVAQCLRSRTPGNIDNSSTTVVQQPVALDTTQITSKANYSNPQPGDPCHPLAAGAHAPAIAFSAMQVRRLIPRECERLQGFSDDYTAIPLRRVPAKGQQRAREQIARGEERFAEIDGVVWVVSADGPRYKALGNSWAVPVVRWIGRRIDAAIKRAA